MERDRVRDAADVARDDRHGAELSHRAGVAEDDAVEEAPAHLRQRHAEERLPAAGAERERRLFLVVPLRLHDGEDLARHERERHEDRREDDAGHRVDHLPVVGREERPEEAAPPEEEDEDEPADDGGDREGKVDERDEEPLAAEAELRDEPRRHDAEDEVERAPRARRSGA